MAFNKKELLKQLDTWGFPANEVVLTYEEFFEGNTYETSIGVNIIPKPSINEFRNIFKKLLEDKLVETIFIRIVDIEDPEEWIFSDTVYIIGDILMNQLDNRIKHLSPDAINKGWQYGVPVNAGKYNASKNIYTVFWD